MAFQGDAKNRRNILQGLQQTKSRLQRLHSDSPSKSSLYPVQHGSQSSVFSQPFAAKSGTGVMAPVSRMIHSSPSPSEYATSQQQLKVVLQQASSQSFSFFVPQQSQHGNIIMPVLPRFDSDGQLDTSVS